MSRTFYVYELWNPLTNTVFYVGKGTKTRSGYRRLAEHIKDTRYYKAGKVKRNHKYATIAKILDNGKMPEIKVVYETINERDAIAEEKRLIAAYGRRDNGSGILVNHTDGGEGMTGFKHSDTHKKRLTQNNPGGKAVAIRIVAICATTFQTTTFESIQTAAVAMGSKSYKANIHIAAKRKSRTAYGFFWRFEPEYDSGEDFTILNSFRADVSNRNSKFVEQIDLNGYMVKEWKSASEICRFYGVHVSTLHKHIKRGTEWNGYTWKLKINTLN